MELVAETVDRDVTLEQAADDIEHRLALGRLLGVVVVEEERHRAVRVTAVEGLARVLEGQVEVLLAEDVVPPAAPEPVGLALADRLVDDVERDDGVARRAELAVGVAVVVRDRLDVRLHACSEDLLVLGAVRQGRTGCVGEEPVRGLAVPHERVTVDAEIVRDRVVDELVRDVEREDALGRLDPLRLHRVLRGDLAEVLRHEPGRRVDRLPLVDRDPDGPRQLVAQRRDVRLDGPLGRRDDDVVDEEVGQRGRGLDVEERAVRGSHGVVGGDLRPGVRGHARDARDRVVRRVLSGDVTLDAQPEVCGRRVGRRRELDPRGDRVGPARLEDARDVCRDPVPRLGAARDERGLRATVGVRTERHGAVTARPPGAEVDLEVVVEPDAHPAAPARRSRCTGEREGPARGEALVDHGADRGHGRRPVAAAVVREDDLTGLHGGPEVGREGGLVLGGPVVDGVRHGERLHPERDGDRGGPAPATVRRPEVRHGSRRIPEGVPDDREVLDEVGLDLVGRQGAHVRVPGGVVAHRVPVLDDPPEDLGAARRLDVLADDAEHRGDLLLGEVVEQRGRVRAVGAVVEGQGSDVPGALGRRQGRRRRVGGAAGSDRAAAVVTSPVAEGRSGDDDVVDHEARLRSVGLDVEGTCGERGRHRVRAADLDPVLGRGCHRGGDLGVGLGGLGDGHRHRGRFLAGRQPDPGRDGVGRPRGEQPDDVGLGAVPARGAPRDEKAARALVTEGRECDRGTAAAVPGFDARLEVAGQHGHVTGSSRRQCRCGCRQGERGGGDGRDEEASTEGPAEGRTSGVDITPTHHCCESFDDSGLDHHTLLCERLCPRRTISTLPGQISGRQWAKTKASARESFDASDHCSRRSGRIGERPASLRGPTRVTIRSHR